MRHALTVTLLACMAGVILLAQMKPTAPGTAGDPQWQGVVQMSDGRQFITDGGLALDVTLVKPAALPGKKVPGKILETYMAAPHPDEVGFADLAADPSGRTYRTPKGIPLSATYVNYLRRILPAARVRFHMKGEMDAVTITVDTTIVGVLMPVRK